jgi:hypothetical protein
MTYGDAIEGAKSNARMRVCKDIGVFSEMWDPDWTKAWREKYAESYPEKGKTYWRKKGNGGPILGSDLSMGPAGEPEKHLVMGSNLHKAIEARLNEDGLDRPLVHQYLLEKGKIDLVDGQPSFKTLLEGDAKPWLDKWEGFKKDFARWVNELHGGSQEEMFK